MEFTVLWEYLKNQALTNDFFSGAALAGVLLGILHQARGYLYRAFSFGWNRLFVEFTIHSEDVLYRPLSSWLKKNNFDKFSRRYRIRSNPNDYSTSFGPDYGTFFFRAKGKWIRVRVTKEDGVSSQESNSHSQTRDFIHITYFGFSRSTLDEIVFEALKEVDEEAALLIPVWKRCEYGWTEVVYLERGGYKGIVLDGDSLLDIENDLKIFLSRKEWYEERGVPWRRGYVFYGPPGTGKSSLAKHLASKFEIPLYVFGEKDHLGDIATKFAQIPKKAIVLLEDIDCVYSSNRGKGEKSDPGPMKPSLNSALNALDGVASKEGQIFIMTTNHIEMLDPALIRPGRIDYKLHLGYASVEQAKKIFKKFFPEGDDSQFVINGDHTPADIQGLLLRSEDGRDACQRVRNNQWT